jgi:hypothetical protein
VLGVAGPSHADTGIIRIVIPGAFADADLVIELSAQFP